MKKRNIILIVLVLLVSVLLVCCRSQDNFGRRKAPKNCNTCTKWSK